MDVSLQSAVEQHPFRAQEEFLVLTKTSEAVPLLIQSRVLALVFFDESFRMANDFTGLVFKRDFRLGTAALLVHKYWVRAVLEFNGRVVGTSRLS
jgi:hypothetical protein